MQSRVTCMEWAQLLSTATPSDTDRCSPDWIKLVRALHLRESVQGLWRVLWLQRLSSLDEGLPWDVALKYSADAAAQRIIEQAHAACRCPTAHRQHNQPLGP